jgi:hypothetical protein
MLAHRRGHGCYLIFFTRFDVGRSVCAIEITPTLERPSRRRPNEDKWRREQDEATGRAVIFYTVFEAHEFLTDEDDAANDPIERPTLQQVVLPLWALERRVIKARFAGAGFALAIFGLPCGEVFDGIGADAEFDEMHGHFWFVRQRR